ncbi:3-dehydro-L-gulonate 2-dehydrogenase [Anaerotruncus sp. AF02-27]|uniref:3-dehydro-L-gulonate 2-dehydrogenase n=1 Tax=Anaerotruncus TaxID=244127 RepID=UPI000E55642A|nr:MULTISPECIES: 3-dehydro-L-gulonate 2-dehydrogenase [Anaerotruncus]RGX54982.1 3-dehydro-L-gulonate 2-dehydrogenase [Anaerotruncus sp. AF02-27]
MRIPFDEMVNELTRILIKYGFSEERARKSATLFAENSLDGIYSHGVNRFPRVISYIEKGLIDVDAAPTFMESVGAVERWNGNLGMGNLNAQICMTRAVELAHRYGIGCVALQNTSHWMRGGSYGWQAANAGCIGICWTNTQPNMPAWGAKDRRIGNNPFVIAVPRANGRHVVVDCAMAQYSYGKIEEYRRSGASLPFPGGFDGEGRLTCDPAEIEKSQRVLPMGYWKGSGISIALDLVAAMLSGGRTVTEIGRQGEDEYGLSQFLLAIDPGRFNTPDMTDAMVDAVVNDIADSMPDREGGQIRYPGQKDYETRMDNLANGIPVIEEIWERIKRF